jgi:hypothetical protein
MTFDGISGRKVRDRSVGRWLSRGLKRVRGSSFAVIGDLTTCHRISAKELFTRGTARESRQELQA